VYEAAPADSCHVSDTWRSPADATTPVGGANGVAVTASDGGPTPPFV
jgi:hypothetical protein